MIFGLTHAEIEEALVEALNKKTDYIYGVETANGSFRIVDEHNNELYFSDMEYFVNVKGV